MVPRLSPAEEAPAPRSLADIENRLLPLLNQVRLSALSCRVAAREDLFRACALLSSDEATAANAHLTALIRCLGQVISRPPVFYRPGVFEMSFDEAWLMRLFSAFAANDADSFHFLLRSRVSRPSQRNMAFLIGRISQQFSQI